jgi:hypothetical protein
VGGLGAGEGGLGRVVGWHPARLVRRAG